MLKGFRDFILRGNVVDLAIAVIIGAAFNSVVNALVADIITPLIGAAGGTPDFSQLSITVNNSQLKIGNFLNAIISFFITASVVYFGIVTPMSKLMSRIKKGEKVDPTEKACPYCLSLVPLLAKKCKFCTSPLK